MDEKDKALQMVEEIRKSLLAELDRLDMIQKQIENGEVLSFSNEPKSYPFSMSPHFFKGKKPTAIKLPGGDTVPISTWRTAAIAILKDCNADADRHKRLMDICDKVSGRKRCILSHDPFDMDVPLKIDEGLYFEGKLDTEYLIKMMTERVFPYVGYDFKSIIVTLRTDNEPVLLESDEIEDDRTEVESEDSSPQLTL